MVVWRAIPDKHKQAGFVYDLSERIREHEARHPNLLHSVSEGIMHVASDYSGQHKKATHEVYTFLVTAESSLMNWLPKWSKFRNEWLPDGRRISYKRLNDSHRLRALPAYLMTMGELKGNLITIMVDKKIGSFMLGGSDAIVDIFPDCFPETPKKSTVEKMFRLSNFVAFILCGLRREQQISNWISDHDEALDTHEKREGFSRLASYTTFGLTEWLNPGDHYFGTTEMKTSPPWAEDFVAVTDLVAGAFCNMSADLPAFTGKKEWQIRVAPESIDDDRSRIIGNWLASEFKTLRAVTLRLEKDSCGGIRSSIQTLSTKIRPNRND